MRFSPKAAGVLAALVTVAIWTSFIVIARATAHRGLTPLASAPRGEIVFQMVFQGMGSVVISGISFTKMVQHFGPVRPTMITAVVSGLSALGAVPFLGEPLYWNWLAGLALVTLGIVFGLRGQARRMGESAPDLVAAGARPIRAKP